MNKDNQNENEQASKQDAQAETTEAAEAAAGDREAEEVQVAEPVKASPMVIEDPEDVIEWLKENATPIIVGVVIAVLVFAGVSMYRKNQRATELTAQTQLFNAQQSSQFADVLAKYPKTTAAPLAELALGSQLYEEGKYDQARATFTAFVQKNPQHAMLGAAQLGLVQCDEAQMKLDAALIGYEGFIKANKDSYLYALAVFGRSRVFAQLGKHDEARTTLEDYIAGHPKDQWVQRAQTELLYVAKLKRSMQVQPVTGVPMKVESPAAPVAPANTAPPAAKPAGD